MDNCCVFCNVYDDIFYILPMNINRKLDSVICSVCWDDLDELEMQEKP